MGVGERERERRGWGWGVREHTTFGGRLTRIDPGKETGAQVRIIVYFACDKIEAHRIEGGRLSSWSGRRTMNAAIELVLGTIRDKKLIIAPAQIALGTVINERIIRIGHAARHTLYGQLIRLQHLRWPGMRIRCGARRQRRTQLRRQQLHQRCAVRLIAQHQDTGGHQCVGEQGADGHHFDQYVQAYG